MTQAPPTLERIGRGIREEIAPLNAWVALSSWLCRLLPELAFSRVRTSALRAAGWHIGPRSLLYGVPSFTGAGRVQSRLSIGADVMINVGCSFELNEAITIADGVAIGPQVRILTSTHKIGPSTRRAGALTAGPVTIGAGAWIGAGSILLPGVTVAAGAVVAAGSVISRDVAANTLVAGVPAAVAVKRLPG